MNVAFPDANVEGFENLMPSITIPDKDDRHVVACAISCIADLIVTFNIKGFPKNNISKYNIEAQNPDEFILNILNINPNITCHAFTKMVKRLKNPTKTKEEVLAALVKCGLKESVKKINTSCRNVIQF